MPDDPKVPETPPAAAADKPAGSTPSEPLNGEVSRTDAPGAGTAAAAAAPPRQEPPTTSETSSATGQPTPQAEAGTAPAPAKPAPRPAAAPAAKPAAPARPPTAAAPAKPAAHPPPAAAPPSGPPDPPPPASVTPPAFIATLQAARPGAVAALSYWVGDWTIIAPAEKILDVAKHLREAPDAAFDLLSDLTATDWPPRKEGRFDVVYCLYSTRHRHRVRVKVKVGEQQPLSSVTSVWPGANWLEREVYDMFGVNFTGHPDRRRILMPDDWQGFPQRKDYPLEGPGELLMENPLDWLKLRQAREEADIE